MNKRVVFYERSQGFPEEDATDLATFFGTASGFDPRIAWDNSWDDELGQNGDYRDQFLLSFLAQAHIFVGWSPQGTVEPLGVANDPQNVWEALNRDASDPEYDCDFTDGEFIRIDQPALGYDDRAWYVSAPTVEIPGPIGADHINDFIYIIPKDPSGPNDVKLVYSDAFENAAGNPLRCFIADGIAGLQGREVAVAATHRGGEPPAGYFVGIGAKRLSAGGVPLPVRKRCVQRHPLVRYRGPTQ